MATARSTPSPSQREICFEEDTLKYIRLFRNDELHQLAEAYGCVVDDSKSEEGKIIVVTLNDSRVHNDVIDGLNQFITDTYNSLKCLTIVLTKSALEREKRNIPKIKETASAKQVMVDKMTDTKLCLTGGNAQVHVVGDKIRQILGLPPVSKPVTTKPTKNKKTEPTKKTTTTVTMSLAKLGTQNFNGIGLQNDMISELTAIHVKSNVKVHILVQDITKMNVDAIVNAANKHLQHTGGVAMAIAKAGGPAVTIESRNYVRSYGTLSVSGTAVTTAGHLPAKQIIHTVGPHWNAKKSDICASLLYQTFTNVLQTADEYKIKTIAIPAISSGVYGVPSSLVAEIAVASITEFLKRTPQTKLKEVYLVGIDSVIMGDMQSEMYTHIHTGDYVCDTGKPTSATKTRSKTPKAKTPTFKAKTPTPSPKARGTITTGTKSVSLPNGNIDISPDVRPKVPKGQVLVSNGAVDSDKEETDDCCICMCPPDNPKTLPKCKHTFCSDCIDRGFKVKPVCPVCGEIYGEIIGDQPKDGRMEVTVDKHMSLEGYEGYGTIVIDYTFPSGKQTPDMTSPGTPYSGTHRTAYLPDNKQGKKVLKLLKEAFNARLIFTVGRSRTTGADNTVTWNDIHHKTSTHGGPQRFGYPDDTYLSRVQDELAAKGIK